MKSARLVGGALLLVGCVQGPRKLPARTSASMFPTLVLAAAGTTKSRPAPAAKLTLGEAYQRALAYSEQVSLAGRSVTEADIRRDAAWDMITPDIRLTAEAIVQRERKVGTNTLVPGQQFIGGAAINQPLFRKGFIAARDAGDRGHESAQAAQQREREQLARDVAETFVRVLRSRKLADLAKTAVDRAKTQHDLAIARVKAGQALKNVELLAVIDWRRAEFQQVVAQREVDAAAIAFTRLVGQAPPSELELPPTPAMPTPEQAAAVANKRADLRALALEVRAAESEVEVAEGRRWWPRLDLSAGVQIFRPEVLTNTFDWQVVGTLTIPVLQSGVEMTDIALRRNAVHAAQLLLELQQKIVVEEIEQAAIRVASAEKAAELAEKQVAAAREHYKLVDKQVRLGAITFLEVTNAQAVLVEAENAFEVASMERVIAVYDYLFAIGAIDVGR